MYFQSKRMAVYETGKINSDEENIPLHQTADNEMKDCFLQEKTYTNTD